jgi:hypothetical protein
MLKRRMTHVTKLGVSLLCTLWVAACGGAQTEPTTPSSTGASAEASTAEPQPQAAPGKGERPSMTAQECEAAGGTVVGDIGDGAIHKPDYLCASGSPPSASIRAAEGQPVAVEGNVCCPKQ